MPRLPVVSCVDAVKAFERAGWSVKRWGNHIIMTKSGSIVSLSIPNHREIVKGTLRKWNIGFEKANGKYIVVMAIFESVRTHGVVRPPVTVKESPLDLMVESGVL